MNNMEELKQIYKKRKQQLLPLFFGFAAFFVFVRIVLPQWTDVTDVRILLSDKENAVKAKEETIRLLNSLPTEKIESDYALATTALPLQKDIILIFTELNDASSRAGVTLGGFNVKVGDIYSSEKKETAGSKTISGIPYIDILVNVSGQNENLRRFAEELYKSIPLVEIKTIDVAKNDARFGVNFFYKPVALRPTSTQITALKSLSAPEEAQLKELSEWKSNIVPFR